MSVSETFLRRGIITSPSLHRNPNSISLAGRTQSNSGSCRHGILATTDPTLGIASVTYPVESSVVENLRRLTGARTVRRISSRWVDGNISSQPTSSIRRSGIDILMANMAVSADKTPQEPCGSSTQPRLSQRGGSN